MCSMKKQVHVVYSGRVQGVGFRYSARGIAEELGVAGWVKNLPDGKVEIMAEAQEAALRDFLARIGSSFSRYIRDADIDWQSATGDSKDFQIER